MVSNASVTLITWQCFDYASREFADKCLELVGRFCRTLCRSCTSDGTSCGHFFRVKENHRTLELITTVQSFQVDQLWISIREQNEWRKLRRLRIHIQPTMRMLPIYLCFDSSEKHQAARWLHTRLSHQLQVHWNFRRRFCSLNINGNCAFLGRRWLGGCDSIDKWLQHKERDKGDKERDNGREEEI